MAIDHIMSCFCHADLECVALETEGQTGQSLVSSTSFGDNGQLGGRTGHVPAGELDTVGIASLILE